MKSCGVSSCPGRMKKGTLCHKHSRRRTRRGSPTARFCLVCRKTVDVGADMDGELPASGFVCSKCLPLYGVTWKRSRGGRLVAVSQKKLVDGGPLVDVPSARPLSVLKLLREDYWKCALVCGHEIVVQKKRRPWTVSCPRCRKSGKH